MITLKIIISLGALCLTMPAWGADLMFNGACDASAAVLVGPDRLAVGDDEGDEIRIYAPTGGDPLEPPTSLEKQLDQADAKNEADLEGVGELGGRLFWIGSHARNSQGEPRPDRQRVLLTTGALAAVGTPGTQLLPAIVAADQQWKLGLAAASACAKNSKGRLPNGKAFAAAGLRSVLADRQITATSARAA